MKNQRYFLMKNRGIFLMTSPAYIAVDWGTSSFRLWLIGEDDSILGERRSGEGMTSAAQTGFVQVLQSHLDALAAPENLPVIVCGMAGARQGWVEAGYIDDPHVAFRHPQGCRLRARPIARCPYSAGSRATRQGSA